MVVYRFLRARGGTVRVAAFLRILYSSWSARAFAISACCRFFVPPQKSNTNESPSLARYTRYPGPVGPEFTEAAEPFHVRRVPKTQPSYGGGDFGRRVRIESIEPRLVRDRAVFTDVLRDAKRHPHKVTYL